MISLSFCMLMNMGILSIVETSEINIALGKWARSSIWIELHPEYMALDGNLNSSFLLSRKGFQWLMVDLFWRYRINNVVITKQDSNFDDILVAVDDGAFNKLKNIESLKTICEKEPANLKPNTTVYNCSQSIGNFVIVISKGNAKQPLALYEVEAYGIWAENYPEMPNMLLNRNISASGNFSSQFRYYSNVLKLENFQSLVDGMTIPIGCIYIQRYGYADSWFKVDMGKPYYIDYVAYTIRPSAGANEGSKNLIVGFSESDFTSLIRGDYPLCGQYKGKIGPKEGRITIKCNANLPAYRYFIIQQPYGVDAYLVNVCELEAYPASSTVGKIWKNKGAMLLTNYTISTLDGSRSADCVFHCFKLGFQECDSFNFNLKMKKCQLNKHRNGILSQNLIPHKDWSFYTSEYPFGG